MSAVLGPGASARGRADGARHRLHTCRKEGVIDTHIYAPNGMITQGLLTLSAITGQSFYRSGRKSDPAESACRGEWSISAILCAVPGRRSPAGSVTRSMIADR
jgi:hypothetical protein